MNTTNSDVAVEVAPEGRIIGRFRQVNYSRIPHRPIRALLGNRIAVNLLWGYDLIRMSIQHDDEATALKFLELGSCDLWPSNSP